MTAALVPHVEREFNRWAVFRGAVRPASAYLREGTLYDLRNIALLILRIIPFVRSGNRTASPRAIKNASIRIPRMTEQTQEAATGSIQDPGLMALVLVARFHG